MSIVFLFAQLGWNFATKTLRHYFVVCATPAQEKPIATHRLFCPHLFHSFRHSNLYSISKSAGITSKSSARWQKRLHKVKGNRLRWLSELGVRTSRKVFCDLRAHQDSSVWEFACQFTPFSFRFGGEEAKGVKIEPTFLIWRGARLFSPRLLPLCIDGEHTSWIRRKSRAPCYTRSCTLFFRTRNKTFTSSAHTNTSL